MNELRVKTADGKYEVVITDEGRCSHALRHGEEWACYPQNGSVGNLCLALAYDLAAARERIQQLNDTVNDLITGKASGIIHGGATAAPLSVVMKDIAG